MLHIYIYKYIYIYICKDIYTITIISNSLLFSFSFHCYHSATNVIILGTKYKENAVVFLAFDTELPEFGTISKIVVFRDQVIYFLITKYKTVEYNSHFHVFHIQREIRPDKMLRRQEMLATYMPIHTVKPSGQNARNGALFVAPRFMIPDD